MAGKRVTKADNLARRESRDEISEMGQQLNRVTAKTRQGQEFTGGVL
jgi:hypothetical protein